MSEKGTIIVTGGSRGIGASIAVTLAELGYSVACLSRRGELPAVQGASAEAFSRCHGFTCDVTSSDSLRDAFAGAAKLGGPIVGLVNNAGIHLEGPSSNFSRDDYETVFSTNTTSVFMSCQHIYPHMADSGGLIINIGSFFDKMGVKRNLAYCASKAAVGAITRCLAVEWAGKGIRVIDVAPGYITTDLNKDVMLAGPLREYLEKRIPGRTPGTAEDVAKLVKALFIVDSPFLSGETIYIDGAQGIAH
ncbi:SDR family NAD(P)-dependent oxidoreductase [Glaciimonas immobilis]|uniref:NAD(P)-dependent dehydrogenase (Short-subunit alcohol dehydrogenase family) n=1 Tax=Glaciimonas immobilis TaxID=728004 RepID=A0A840RSD7_9BURK|nr:SDR family oxidoreductase [Glaciimonas immobilis]KAF3997074.1 SDR family oxidoreductase [Glaciimonas immobilis]MBB5199928.1 NAD(P)-dependent dehydrogenase (short-subunit alcohol dehydrogenase family) [Glaciimonas immobilis]